MIGAKRDTDHALKYHCVHRADSRPMSAHHFDSEVASRKTNHCNEISITDVVNGSAQTTCTCGIARTASGANPKGLRRAASAPLDRQPLRPNRRSFLEVSEAVHCQNTDPIEDAKTQGCKYCSIGADTLCNPSPHVVSTGRLSI
jgi:hypothetical protein